MPRLSVIICSHNPREDYLRRTLDALRAQTLPLDQWELLLVDNASQVPLARGFDLSWHANGRHIREDELGLTPARLRGIKESKADVLAFVDDDNILAADYLEQALAVGEQWPFVGVWGGSVTPEFEISPPAWIGTQAWRLTLVDVKEDTWSNLREGFASIPVGAGMCVRKSVGLRFLEWCRMNDRSKTLGRKGKALSGYEDHDLAQCAMDVGLGAGRSTRLHLTHLIPASRLTLDYFVRHAEGDAASLMMFRAIRGFPIDKPKFGLISDLKWKIHRLLSRESPEFWAIHEAHRRGTRRGWQLTETQRTPNESIP